MKETFIPNFVRFCWILVSFYHLWRGSYVSFSCSISLFYSLVVKYFLQMTILRINWPFTSILTSITDFLFQHPFSLSSMFSYVRSWKAKNNILQIPLKVCFWGWFRFCQLIYLWQVFIFIKILRVKKGRERYFHFSGSDYDRGSFGLEIGVYRRGLISLNFFILSAALATAQFHSAHVCIFPYTLAIQHRIWSFQFY